VAEWRPIPGFHDYEASSDGEIRPVKPRYRIAPVELFLAEIVGEKIKRRGQVIVPWIETRHRRDAARVALVIDGRRHREFVHRLVCLAFHGLPAEGLTDCCHIDDDSLNNRASNLKWGTHQQNIEEQWERRREMEAKVSDAIGDLPCYNGPDLHSDVPF
jgi:hypothetical protein